MLRPRLSVLRKVISLFILAGLLLFFFVHALGVHIFIEPFLQAQIVPAFLRTLSGLMFLSSLLILCGILLLTLLFGRLYCSTLCPLGTCQDILIFGKRKVTRQGHRFNRPHRILRFGILGIILFSAFFGPFFLLKQFDPFSIFGRIVSGLLKPLVDGLLYNAALILQNIGVYAPWISTVPEVEGVVLVASLFFSLLVVVLVVVGGRLYCNSVCPVGSILGLISRFSVFRIRIDEQACTACGACEKVCKAGCVQTESKTIDTDRCIMCFNCLDVCTFSAIDLRRKDPVVPTTHHKESERREFLSKIGFAILGLGLLSRLKTGLAASGLRMSPAGLGHILPPGSGDLKRFTKLCSGCQKCMTVCPTKVIRTSRMENGIESFMQPMLDYNYNYCEYNCTECTKVCPTKAIRPVMVKAKELLKIGEVILVKNDCIPYKFGRDCGACAEICPTQAVHMVQIKGTLYAPVTDVSICIGCGACQYVCPVRPVKAIYVKAFDPQKMLPERERLKRVPRRSGVRKSTKAGHNGFPF